MSSIVALLKPLAAKTVRAASMISRQRNSETTSFLVLPRAGIDYSFKQMTRQSVVCSFSLAPRGTLEGYALGLLAAQGLERIDLRGPVGRDIRGREGDQGQKHWHGHKCHRIRRADAKQDRLHESRKAEGKYKPGSQAGRRERRDLPNDDARDRCARSTERHAY